MRSSIQPSHTVAFLLEAGLRGRGGVGSVAEKTYSMNQLVLAGLSVVTGLVGI